MPALGQSRSRVHDPQSSPDSKARADRAGSAAATLHSLPSTHGLIVAGGQQQGERWTPGLMVLTATAISIAMWVVIGAILIG